MRGTGSIEITAFPPWIRPVRPTCFLHPVSPAAPAPGVGTPGLLSAGILRREPSIASPRAALRRTAAHLPSGSRPDHLRAPRLGTIPAPSFSSTPGWASKAFRSERCRSSAPGRRSALGTTGPHPRVSPTRASGPEPAVASFYLGVSLREDVSASAIGSLSTTARVQIGGDGFGYSPARMDGTSRSPRLLEQ